MLVSKYLQMHYPATASNITLISGLVDLLMEKDPYHDLT